MGFCRSRLGPATGMVGTHWQSTAGFWILEEPAPSGDSSIRFPHCVVLFRELATC
jgi:hypothetical protein